MSYYRNHRTNFFHNKVRSHFATNPDSPISIRKFSQFAFEFFSAVQKRTFNHFGIPASRIDDSKDFSSKYSAACLVYFYRKRLAPYLSQVSLLNRSLSSSTNSTISLLADFFIQHLLLNNKSPIDKIVYLSEFAIDQDLLDLAKRKRPLTDSRATTQYFQSLPKNRR